MKLFTSILFALFSVLLLQAQGPGHSVIVTYPSNYGNGTQTLTVFKPYDSTSSTYKHPVIIAMNGSGERGSTAPAASSIGDLCNHNATMRFYNTTYSRYSSFVVLSPVLPTSQGVWGASYVKDVIDYMKANLSSLIDTTQVYVTGLSLGGGGVLNFISDNARGNYYANFIAAAAAFSPTADYQDETTFFNHVYDNNLNLIIYGCVNDENSQTLSAVSYLQARQNITYPSKTPQIKFVRPITGGHYGGWLDGYDTTNTLTLTVDSNGTNKTYVNNPNVYVRLLMSSRPASTPTIPSCTSNTMPANAAIITTQTSVSLAWNAAAGANSYDIYLWTGSTAPTTATYTATTNSYAATGLIANTLYKWYVVPKNSAGSASGCSGNFTSFTTATAPAPPACTSNSAPVNGATVSLPNSASLTWTAVSGATSYDIYLWTGSTVPSTPVTNTTATSYSAAGLTASTLYNWYIAPKNAAGTASGCIANKTSFTTAANTTPPNGNGLEGVYYNGINLIGTPLLTRIDSTVNYDLGFSSPAPGVVPTDSFSVRWSGQVKAQYSESYTFFVTTDDGVRLWVNGVQLVNNWVNQGAIEKSGTINMIAGQKYDIVMEYFENTGGATAKLSWSSASTAKAIIPYAQLFPPSLTPPACTTNSSPLNGSTISSSSASNLAWAAAAGASSYDIYIWSGSTAPTTASYNTTVTSYIVSGLTASTLYNWYIVPKNAGGAPTGCSGNKTTFTTAAASVGTGLQGVYYNGITLSGSPILTRIDTTINFDLGFNSPAPGVVPTDTYSVRWTGRVQPQYSETYTFYTVADDGIRLWVNGVQLVDNWVNQGATENNGTLSLVAGQKYDIVVEYYENTGGAVTKLLWSSPSTAKSIIPVTQLFPPVTSGTGLQGVYYNGITLSGSPLLTRTDSTINFDFGTASPAAGTVPADMFSVRWSGKVKAVYSETYTFYTEADDGIRLWVNGVQLINNYVDQPPTVKSGTITLVAGQLYDIVVEYYENMGGAVAKLSWSSASTPQAIIPMSQLYPAGSGARIAVGSSAQELVTPEKEAVIKESAAIIPNPARRGQPIKLQVNSTTATVATLSTINSAGVVMQMQKANLIKGSNYIYISSAALTSGFYVIKVVGTSIPHTLKVIIN